MLGCSIVISSDSDCDCGIHLSAHIFSKRKGQMTEQPVSSVTFIISLSLHLLYLTSYQHNKLLEMFLVYPLWKEAAMNYINSSK